jgi:hypothetical protein
MRKLYHLNDQFTLRTFENNEHEATDTVDEDQKSMMGLVAPSEENNNLSSSEYGEENNLSYYDEEDQNSVE